LVEQASPTFDEGASSCRASQVWQRRRSGCCDTGITALAANAMSHQTAEHGPSAWTAWSPRIDAAKLLQAIAEAIQSADPHATCAAAC